MAEGRDRADRAISVLLIEDSAGAARLAEIALSDASEPFDVRWVDRLSRGLDSVDEYDVDVALLDLYLPDSRGMDTFERFRQAAPGVPVLVLAGTGDEALGREAVARGAVDHLSKADMQGAVLPVAIRHALERQRLGAELRDLALVDELTGLHTRRAFDLLARHEIRSARRGYTPLALIVIEVDGLARINREHGRDEGSRALLTVARVLTETFRQSDVVARLGGDDFSVLLSPCEGEQAALSAADRLREAVDGASRQDRLPYRLTVSIGVGMFEPSRPAPLRELVSEADRRMRQDRLRSRAVRGVETAAT